MPLVLVVFLLFCPLPCLRGVLELAPSVSNVLIILSTSMSSWIARVCPQCKECSYYFVHFHVFLECSSLPLVLIMFSLFCALPCLRGVLEFPPSVSNVLIILSTSMSS